MLASPMPSGFTRDEVAAIARLAHLELETSELDLFTRQLSDVLAYAAEVQQIDTAGIERLDPALHAFNTIAAERALAHAESIDRDFDRWRDTPLAAVPVALKDNLCTRGVRTTASSRILDRYVPPYDATAVARLEAA